jgi:hypothetical protein
MFPGIPRRRETLEEEYSRVVVDGAFDRMLVDSFSDAVFRAIAKKVGYDNQKARAIFEKFVEHQDNATSDMIADVIMQKTGM